MIIIIGSRDKSMAYTGIVCILGPIRRRGISLGNHHSRSEMGPFGRLLHRLD